MSTIVSHSLLNISETIRDRGLVPNDHQHVLQPDSAAAEVDHTSVTAGNKQIDRRRAPVTSLRAEWGGGVCCLQEC